ncbi:hypothetical protein BpHYR1_033853 [Brachionus plicatilis]|uniref:Uncharacterized protein n=1 Tax=Brachionus plicatilis TaxID=10195 RepID=A0A3M7T022_BRAPC|nr:hypothetical protein BpHYR1_033853 [Brachionus plicatilis]
MHFYFETYYIGNLKKNSLIIRKVPSFPILSWNCHDKVLDGRQRTNNTLEAWRLAFENDVGKHSTVNKLVEQFRLEQKNTDILYTQLMAGDQYEKTFNSKLKEKKIKNIVDRSYSFDTFVETALFLLDEKQETKQSQRRTSTSQPNPKPYQSSDNAALRSLLKSKSYQLPQDTNRINRLNEIRAECLEYLDFIEEITNRQKSTQAFWSDAFIKRFFSICGLASDKRSTNMNSETLIDMVLMRVNIDLKEYRSTLPVIHID